MFQDVPSDREEVLIEQAAQYIINNDLEEYAIPALEYTASFGDIVGELGLLMSYPVAALFLAQPGADIIKMLGLNYEKNATRVLQRVKELSEMKKKLQHKHFESEKNENQDQEGIYYRFITWLRRLFIYSNDKKS